MQTTPFEQATFFVAASFQLAAMVFTLMMSRVVKDRRPWLLLFSAMFLMFVIRCLAIVVPAPTRAAYITPFSAPAISLLLFISLFSMRRIALAERDSENRYRQLVELSPDTIIVLHERKIAYCNPAALRFLGAASVKQIIGLTPEDVVAPESMELVKQRLELLANASGPLRTAELLWKKLDGSLVPVETVSATIPWQRGTAVQVIVRDISERKRVDEEKGRLLAMERVARSNAEHANRMKDEFLATLSHELRTPLNAILGWSQLLRTGNSPPEELNQGLDTIERNARAQTQLIEDLLDMSRIISGKLRLDIQQVAPASFVKAAIETVRPAADAKGIRIEQILDPAAGPISGDPNRLQQVTWNLLSNAVKFTPRGGKVQIILQRINSHIELTIADTGMGISQEFLPFLFERFRQADSTTTRRHGGLGLGLSIVRQLVDLHGGTIVAKSAGTGQGSTFVVSLPLTVVLSHTDDGDRVHPSAAALDPGAPPHADLSGLKILVVDDEPDAREVIRRLLVNCRADVVLAASATEAMPLVTQADVLLSDIGMPDVDGYEFLRRVRSARQGNAHKIPAIALTAFARSEDRTRALMAGYQVHISKPVSAAELIAAIASVTGRTGQSGQG